MDTKGFLRQLSLIYSRAEWGFTIEVLNSCSSIIVAPFCLKSGVMEFPNRLLYEISIRYKAHNCAF